VKQPEGLSTCESQRSTRHSHPTTLSRLLADAERASGRVTLKVPDQKHSITSGCSSESGWHTPADGYCNVSAGHVWAFNPLGKPDETLTLTPQGRLTSNNGEAMRDMALRGLGLSVLPAFIVHSHIADGLLLALEPGVRPIDDQIYALYPRSSRASRKVLALCDFLQQALANQPWAQTA
jgi:DNA-binding transcriptional LysR family regulator